MVKNLPTNAGGARDIGSITWFRKSLGVGNGNQFQYSCLGNPMDSGDWWATVHGVTRVRHDLATKQQHSFCCSEFLFGVCVCVSFLFISAIHFGSFY